MSTNLEALGVYDQAAALQDSYARILVVGPPKAGKTTCLATSAPSPLILNCDGHGATRGASNSGGKFLAIDVQGVAGWKRAVTNAATLVQEGTVRTVIVDTVTLLASELLDELSLKLDGWDLWGELRDLMRRGIGRLCKLDAHVFIVAHMMPDRSEIEDSAGILPSIPGKLKVEIPGMLADWILLDVDPERTPHPRMWVLGPQKRWKASGRHIQGSSLVPATVPALFDALGLAE